jgi:crossover junction endodeoxyribonuclease RuvC
MVILGIDPSLASTGWAILQKTGDNYKYLASGTFTTKPKQDTIDRLNTIRINFETLLQTHKPQVIIIEENYISINPQGSIKLALARGVILSVMLNYKSNAKLDVLLHQTTPAFVKKAITGSGAADKTQVEKMIKIIIPQLNNVPALTNDETDAIAIALVPFTAS